MIKLDCLHYLFKLSGKDCVLLNNGVTTLVPVGRDLGWPLARDEPVVKLDRLHYLFTLPDKDGGLLNYGVSFADAALLPSFAALLKSNSCFSTPSAPSRGSRPPPPASASRVM